jgi:Protein of unknown function (DUF2939)
MKPKYQGLLVTGVLGSFMCGGALYASPYLSLYQMYQDVEHKDLESFATHVDFPALRESVKDNLRSLISRETAEQKNPLMSIFGSVMKGFVLDPIVDSVVTPSGVAALMAGQQIQIDDRNEAAQFSQVADKVEVNGQYESFNEFAVAVKPKGQETEPITFVLSRDGLSWKISGVRLPDSLSLTKGLLPKSAIPNLDDSGSASKFLKGLI